MSIKNSIKSHFEKSDNLYNFLLIILLITACFTRLFFYFNHKDLWLDELAIALALLNMDFSELLTQPLPYLQSAPLGFMLVSKLLTSIYLDTLTLYFIPLLSSLCLIFLTYKFMQRYFDTLHTTVYMSLFTMSVVLLFYSTELKQYIVETLIAFYLVWYFLKNKDEICRFISFKFLALICILTLFSSSIPFIICTITCAVLYQLRTINNIFSYIRKNIVQIICFIAFYLSYYFFYLKKTSVEGMQQYWQFSFLPLTSFSDFTTWFKNIFLYVTEYLLYIPFSISGYRIGGILFLVFFLYGSYLLFKKNKDLFFCTCIPLFIVLLVSALKMYPMGTDGVRGARFILFLYPILLIPLTVSIVKILQLVFKKEIVKNVILSIGVFAVISINIALILYNPKIQQTEKLIEYIQENYSSKTGLMIYSGAEHAYNYYAHKNPLEHTTFNEKDDSIHMINEYMRHKDSVMILFSHYGEEYASEKVVALKKLKYNVLRLKDIGAELIIVNK